MTVQEELMREIIEMLKGFTIVVAVLLTFMYLIIAGLAVYAILNEKKEHKKTAGSKPAENENNYTTNKEI